MHSVLKRKSRKSYVVYIVQILYSKRNNCKGLPLCQSLPSPLTVSCHIAAGRDWSHVPGITRIASWPLAQRGALINPPQVFAVTLLPQILSHTVTRISIGLELHQRKCWLPWSQRCPFDMLQGQTYTMMLPFTSTTCRNFAVCSDHAGSPNVKDCLCAKVCPVHFTCKYCCEPGAI